MRRGRNHKSFVDKGLGLQKKEKTRGKGLDNAPHLCYNVCMKNETYDALSALLFILYMFCGVCAVGVALVILGEISKLFSA